MAFKVLTLLLAASTSAALQEWTIQDLTYTSTVLYSTPAHLAVHNGVLSFNLTNPDISAPTACSGFSQRDPNFFYSDTAYPCNSAGVTPSISTGFNYGGAPSGVLIVNQTWTDAGGVKSASARIATKLDCNTDVYKNPAWQMGSTFSSTKVTCKPITLKVTPVQV